MPVRTYSSGMKARLAFGTSMGMHFDTYLVDEVTAVGDPRFKRKSQAVFRERMRNASAVFVSHSIPQLRQYCDCGIVLEGGRARYFDDLEEAIALTLGKYQVIPFAKRPEGHSALSARARCAPAPSFRGTI